ncbi:MAG TPA: DUF177 domain-containing protein [Coleofasciculaceae cyanobacterium]|jgi:uncharacterized metal-binding protein YceD (DUF177 family)
MEAPRDTSAPQEPVEKIKISDIRSRNSVLRFQEYYRFDDLQTSGDVPCDWEIRPETAGFSVRGKLNGEMNLECVRCLAGYSVPIDLEINERYVYDSYVDPFEREKELQADDFFEVANEEGVLDLKDLVHQFLILESEHQSTCGRSECDFSSGDLVDA